MKTSRLFLALLTLLASALSSCNKQPEPTPRPAPGHQDTVGSTYLEFRLFDAADGDQFNAALNARVYYFPLSWTETQINAYFGNPATNDNWNDSPRAADEEFDFDNVVAPGTTWAWSADPGFIHLDLEPRQQIAIVWTFTEADPRARRGYRQQLFIWNGLGENQVLKTDQLRAGL